MITDSTTYDRLTRSWSFCSLAVFFRIPQTQSYKSPLDSQVSVHLRIVYIATKQTSHEIIPYLLATATTRSERRGVIGDIGFEGELTLRIFVKRFFLCAYFPDLTTLDFCIRRHSANRVVDTNYLSIYITRFCLIPAVFIGSEMTWNASEITYVSHQPRSLTVLFSI